MITRKSKIIFSAITLLVLAGAIGVGAYHVFAVATNQAGVGYGAIGMDSYSNVSVGSSSPNGVARFVVNASSGASTYTLKALSSTGASLFSVDNSGNVVTAGSLTAGSFVGNLSGTVTAGNISSGAFGANTGGGIYSFPSNIGISGDTTPAQTGLLSLGYSVTNGYAWIQSFNSKPLTLNPVGNNVGIGTTNPTTALAVVGNVSSTGLCLGGVCNTTWPTSGVSSIFGRTGAVVAASGDYSVAQVTGAAPLASPTFTGSVTMPGGIWNSSGNVGIGTTAPGTTLDVNGYIRTEGADYQLQTQSGWGGWSREYSITNPSAAQLVGFGALGASPTAYTYAYIGPSYTSPTAVFTSSGNVGIGTTAPAQKLSVAGTIQSTSGGIMFPDGTTQTTAASGSTVVTAGNVSAGTFGANTGGGNYAFSGNVGIGATTASVKLVVSGAANASSPTLGSAAVGESALLSNNGLYGLYSGVSNDGDVWMQAQRNDAGTSVYNILLNPNGGNVGIGTTAPQHQFVVSNAGAAGIELVTTGGASGGPYIQSYNRATFAYSPLDFYASQYDFAQGNVGIGTTGPVQKLSVAGEVAANEGTWGSGGYSFIQDGSQDTGMFSPSDGVIDFYDNQVHSINISAAGNATFYGSLTAGGGLCLSGTCKSSWPSGSGYAWNWSGQGGQPPWVWGGSDGTNMYVYNPSNFSVNYANYAGAMTGSYTGNGGQQGPSYFGTTRVGSLMMNTVVNGNGDYKNWLFMDSYGGSDVGGATAIGLDRMSPRAFLLQSDATRSSWNNSAELLSTYNYSGYALPLSGGTVTGATTFNAGPYTNDWFRVNGSGGIVWQSYGGGWYMQDTTWIRSYGSKPVYMSNGFDSGAASGVNCGGGLGNGYTFDVCGTANVASDLTVAGNLSVSNKITATTFDPVYTIGGTNYATYLPGMTGVKEETAGTLDLQRNSDGSYSSTINFASEPTGGDVWLFAKATDMPGAMSQLVVSLTPSFSGNVWYEKNAALGTLTIHGSAAGEVSYNLTAPRFDASQWTNIGDPNAKGLLVK